MAKLSPNGATFLSHFFLWPRDRLVALFRWTRRLTYAVWQLWRALGPDWLKALVLILALCAIGHAKISAWVAPNLTTEQVHKVHYLNQGWSSAQRDTYYYAPQGTELLGLDYEWLSHLELPLSRQPLASARNMRGWGFIVEPGQMASTVNPENLPIGFSFHIDPATGSRKLDIGCALCHTGELHFQGTALRVDGGQSLQSLADPRRGEFIATLGASVIETLYNPWKWDRFASRVAGQDKSARNKLKQELKAFDRSIRSFAKGPGAAHWYPVTEGRGRTDAVGRIANIVFGYRMNKPDNYRPADAPASYPFIWDIWRFDWVQYTGFTNQPMARNIGESLGVLAPITLVDEQGDLLTGEKFTQTTIDINSMLCVENLLRKLEPPRWPEDILGPIDDKLAQAGRDLFLQNCHSCHGPHRSEPYRWPVATDGNNLGQTSVNPRWDNQGDVSELDNETVRVDWRPEIWAIPWVKAKDIGTDPTLANNYINNTYDASAIDAQATAVSAGDGLQLLLNQVVPTLYQRNQVTGAEVANYDGFNVPFRITNEAAYTPRPLHGVWATPPFLHNGSVPTLYHLLSSLEQRPVTFMVGNREYDPKKLGYVSDHTEGAFKFDTTIKGNFNSGHLFTDLDQPGRIGKRFSESDKMALLEYLKVMGNPDFTQRLGGDPLNWAQYPKAPSDPAAEAACER
jgi:hypothetical protein